ncbi:MAG TPA: Asp-tRNA(Asn)/Glu-tRNA(Gln) amidotransferase GatCAB subunit A [Phycisphaerales bacterium]|nr:Asp-tRNA(Asn)/Glu-tRNA(Gln) amidotransferase GatCAB subunit A [Phycisphaerales bacterium]
MTSRDFRSCREIRDEIRAGKISAESVMKDTLERIRILNPETNAFRETFDDEAMNEARKIDERLARGENPGPLTGVPIGIKDNIATIEGTTSCGSRMLEGYRSPYEATVVTRLREAGAIPVGRTNCDEFAMGSSTESCVFGAVRNPWDTGRVPGGSSGGSSAAVAAGLVPATLGSDTGGSIRQPAALCGCVGLKPSYGRVSRYGLVAFGSSLDQIGPLTRSVEDASIILDVICGVDDRDSTSAPEPAAEARLGGDFPEGLRVGVPKQYREPGTNEPAVDADVDRAIGLLKEAGAEIIDIDLPLTKTGISTYYVIAPAEASSNLARYDGIRYGHRSKEPIDSVDDLYARSRSEGFGPEVQRRIMLGTYVLSSGYYDAYYNKALKVRRLIKQEFDRAFEQCDVLLGPTAPSTAFELGGKPDPVAMYLCDIYTVNNNMAGICGISIPSGTDDSEKALPIGLHLQAQAFDEKTLLEAAGALETLLRFEAASLEG